MIKGATGWIAWQLARWKGESVPDYYVDADGTFYCDHECVNLEQHMALVPSKEQAL